MSKRDVNSEEVEQFTRKVAKILTNLKDIERIALALASENENLRYKLKNAIQQAEVRHHDD